MGDPTKFHCLWEYYAFNTVFICLLLSEFFIYFYTMNRGDRARTVKCDHGTKCIFVSFFSVSQRVPSFLRSFVFPSFVSVIGIFIITAGIAIRLAAVMTLKRAFTLNVQTTSEQRLITAGIYHKIRHPAYSGSILSLSGVALSFRNVLSVIVVIICCLICYGVRIKAEEKALQMQFGSDYSDYKKSTYRLIPYIF